MEKRRLELIEAECRRHAALARVDAARRAEHGGGPGVGASLSREGGAHMRIGEAYTFVPAAFGAEIGGKDTKTIPRRVTGHIEYINRAHRYFTVRVDTGRGILRESFKF